MSEVAVPASGGATGGCLCGAVRYATALPARDVAVCHCDLCRRQSGAAAMGVFGLGAVTIADPDAALRWHAATPKARRGFCARCGGQLFWRLAADGAISVTAGSLDDAAGLRIAGHIHVERQPAFYAFDDAAPRLTGAQAESLFHDAVPQGETP